MRKQAAVGFIQEPDIAPEGSRDQRLRPFQTGREILPDVPDSAHFEISSIIRSTVFGNRIIARDPSSSIPVST